MFKKFFNRDVEEETEEIYDKVDPVVEQRRKEKFSMPLIYNDIEEEQPETVVEPMKQEKKKKPVPESTYQMSEIISPMNGVQKQKKETVTISKPKIKKPRKESDELIQVLSPFYGNTSLDEDVVEDVEDNQEMIETVDSENKELTVEDNLRNIANIVKEEQDQLKIIEERTGEFKLDLKNTDENSLIDEIDDSMSLDELMTLYEKKFKD